MCGPLPLVTDSRSRTVLPSSLATTNLAPSGERRTRGASETRLFGRELAAALAPGDLVALEGDLGTGKTCLVQGICAGLGVDEVVNSPTFVLLNVYAGAGEQGALRVYHFDLYRLETVDELAEIGADQFFHEADAVTLVEWADRLPELLPEKRWRVGLEYGDEEQERRIRWRRPGAAAGSPGKDA